jgi:hypothetical protein
MGSRMFRAVREQIDTIFREDPRDSTQSFGSGWHTSYTAGGCRFCHV